MNEYFRSITREMDALRCRVRNTIKGRVWLADGEWKECVLRTFLRRNLHETLAVARGFVIYKDGESARFDILIYDRSYPVLFRDGDMVFITPDAVRAVVEVRARLELDGARTALEKLSSDSRRMGAGMTRRVFALFAYDLACSAESIISELPQSAQKSEARVVSLLGLGSDHIIEFWHRDPLLRPRTVRRWHLYHLPEQAPGLFVHKLMERISAESVQEHAYASYHQQDIEDQKLSEAWLCPEMDNPTRFYLVPKTQLNGV